MSKLIDILAFDIKEKKEPETSDENVIKAMEKALDSTTPERAGTPWDKDEVVEESSEDEWL